jgi:phosphoribosylamine--glycine ligase
MNILVLGSGAREHVFALKLSQSPLCTNLFVAPGNAGTAQIATNVPLDLSDFNAIHSFCLTNNIALVVPGNEDPLVAGITNFLEKSFPGLMVAGPAQKGAQLEGSKDFAKEFMLKYGVPTARFSTFTKETLQRGLQFLETLPPPFVLKADGLAAGKGVVICPNLEDAKKELSEMLLQNKFGNASNKVVIEEFLHGIEMSCFVLTDGKSYMMLPEAKDYKRIGEGDTGLNTGGMGAISPVPFADKTFMDKVVSKVVEPTIAGLRKEKSAYKGFVFIGLMNCNGEPFVIEYNVRMGDPETQVVLSRIKNDLVELLVAVCNKNLHQQQLLVSEETACTVFTVSKGYPENYPKGLPISGLEKIQNCIPFHAGTTLNNEGVLVTNGGRVISLTALDHSLEKAVNLALKAADEIQFDGKYFRKDIGQDLIALSVKG